MDVYQNAYRAMPNPLNPFEFMQNARTSTSEKADSEKRTSSSGRSPETRQPSTSEPKPDNVQELRDRVADLEKLVAKFADSKKAKKRN